MKEIKAVIQPFKLDHVLNALHQIGDLPSLVISEASAIDVGHDLFERVPKIKLELMVPDQLVDKVVGAIRAAAHTGQPGDGRIFVIPIQESILIRTGARSEDTR
jgi:nitrogen regulatory protein P-II 1